MRRLAALAVVVVGSAGCGGEQPGGEAASAPTAPTTRVGDAGREVLDSLRVGPDRRELARNGVSITVPPDWDGRILFRDEAGSHGAIFQVANFELPSNEGFEPPRELPPGQEDPIKAMDAGDVLINVVGDQASGEPAPATITLDDFRFLPADAPRVPRGHTLAERSFCYGARCVGIEIDFGGSGPDLQLRNRVHHVLASLQVEEQPRNATSADGRPRGCPRENWPGPWTACADAQWVRRIAEEAGYRVVGETGSALVAQGRGRSFYIWTTRGEQTAQAIADDEGGDYLASVAGVRLYGDDDWRFWDAQGFIFWVHEGPRGESIVPSPAELAQLLLASTRVPPPE